jgi:hypothetical protein
MASRKLQTREDSGVVKILNGIHQAHEFLYLGADDQVDTGGQVKKGKLSSRNRKENRKQFLKKMNGLS